jgi:hypothetical protein
MKPLTARGVKMILTRAGVNHSELKIFADPTIWRDIETGRTHTYIVISGPARARKLAASVLYGRGLQNAPYPEYDSWARP